MIYNQWKNIDKHIKNAFCKIDDIKNITSIQRIDNNSVLKKVNLKDNISYNCPLTFLSVSIANKDELIDQTDTNIYHVIVREYLYGVTKIMNIYNASYVKIINDSIYCFFQTKTKDDIQEVVDCSIDINTFNQHINKRIKKDISDNIKKIQLGIGMDYSEENLLSNLNINNAQDIFITSNALDNSLLLSSKSNHNYTTGVLISEIIKNNLTDDETKSSCNFVANILGFNCYSFDLYFTSYQNWINNNA